MTRGEVENGEKLAEVFTLKALARFKDYCASVMNHA